MKFLDQVFLDNTIRSYFIVGIIILAVFILKRIISKYATRLIYRLGKTQWGGMSKEEFDDIIIRPMEKIILAIVIIITLGQLRFPEALLFTVHKVSSRTIVESIASAAIIICAVSLLIRFMDFIALVIEHRSQAAQKPGKHQLIFFFKDLIRVVIIIFGIVFILKFSFSLDIGNLLTGLSIVGAALALAARESLENLIASFILFFDKPFETGDYVKVNNVAGTVERIGLRSTRVRTSESSLITIPNKQMVDSILDNFSERHSVRYAVKTRVASETPAADLEKAVTGIREILAQENLITSPNVSLSEIGPEGALIESIYYLPTGLSLEVSSNLLQKINISIRKMEEAFGILPANSHTITLSKPPQS